MTHIDQLGLSVRASHCLLSVAVPPITTVEALANTSDSELMRIQNFGRVSLAECRAAQRQWLHEHQADDRLLSLTRPLAASMRRPH